MPRPSSPAGWTDASSNAFSYNPRHLAAFEGNQSAPPECNGGRRVGREVLTALSITRVRKNHWTPLKILTSREIATGNSNKMPPHLTCFLCEAAPSPGNSHRGRSGTPPLSDQQPPSTRGKKGVEEERPGCKPGGGIHHTPRKKRLEPLPPVEEHQQADAGEKLEHETNKPPRAYNRSKRGRSSRASGKGREEKVVDIWATSSACTPSVVHSAVRERDG